MNLNTVAVLGLGSIGLRHAGNLIRLGNRVVGYDLDPNRCRAVEGIGGLMAESRQAAMASAHAVVIATPNACHLEDLSAAVCSGRHVFIEKPLAHTDDGLEKILNVAEQEGLVIFSGFNLRFNPAVREGKKLLDQGMIGKPLWARLICASYLPDWRPAEDYRRGYAADPLTGGVLFDLIHEFDLANHLLGSARTVAATARNSGLLEIESEDCADVILLHDCGVHSNLHMDYVTRPPLRITEVAGESGMIRLGISRRHLSLMDRSGQLLRDDVFDSGPDSEYLDEMRAFLACIRKEENVPCNGWETLEVLRQVIEARRLSGYPGPGTIRGTS